MTRIVMLKEDGALKPATGVDADLLSKIETGRPVVCEVKQSRNLRQHRLYWALVGACFEHQSLYTTPEKLSDGIKLSCGYSEEVRDINGNIHFKPSSISFERMSGDEFRFFFERALDLIITRIIPAVGRESLEETVYSMLGEPGPSALLRP